MSEHKTYRTRIVYEIIENGSDEVMDRIVEDLMWPATAEQAIQHKYKVMNHIYSKSADGETELMKIAREVMAA